MSHQKRPWQKKPDLQAARWAQEQLSFLYELAEELDRRNFSTAYRLVSELCHEIDRIWATRDYIQNDNFLINAGRENK